ncbi:MAG: DUF4239 domain-containing protein [Propionivibrio sp.]|nr:DUF4239 domain-containing protein [Propionivibrio sp.]
MSLSASILLLPQWLAISLLVVISVSFSIIGFLVVHRFVPTKVRQIHNDVAGFVYGSLGVTYGVLLGFVVIVVWGQLNDAKVNAAHESSIALVLYNNIMAYPDKTASITMKRGFLRYIRQVVEAQDPTTVEPSTRMPAAPMDQLLALVDGIVPSSGHEQILFTQILQNMNELATYYHLREQASREELPDVIWIGIVVGAIITIGFTFLFGTENFWAHIIMTSLLATMIAVVIYVVIEMDHPTMGAVTIGIPDSYSQILVRTKAEP